MFAKAGGRKLLVVIQIQCGNKNCYKSRECDRVMCEVGLTAGERDRER